MSDEDLIIKVSGDGVDSLKSDLVNLGKAGSNAADEIAKAFNKALDSVAENNSLSTNLAREAKIAMNSFAQMQKEAAAASRAAANEAAAAAKQAAQAEASAAKQAAAEQRASDADSAASARELMDVKKAMYRIAQMDARAAAKAEADAARLAAQEEIAARRSANAQTKALLAAETAATKAALAEQTAAKRKQAADARNAERDLRDQARGSGIVAGALSIIGIREAIKDFVSFSDEMQNTRNRLSNVSSSTEEADNTLQKLRQTATDTRTSFDLTTRSYQRTALATKALGLSQSENVTITKVLNQATAVAGTTSEEAHGTLIQLSQAFASNKLSGDEFRSVAEQMPILLDLIAKATGKPRNSLKELGQQGGLTAAVLAYSFLKSQQDMQKAFDKTQTTISQALTNIHTNFTFFIKDLNDSTGASHLLTEALVYIGTHGDTVASVLRILGELVGVTLVLQLGKAAIALRALALANPWTALILGATAFVGYLHEHNKEINDFLTKAEDKLTGRKLIDHYTKDSSGKLTPVYGDAQTVRAQMAADAAKSDAAKKAQQAERNDIQMLKDEAHLDALEAQAKKDLANLKKKKGRHVPTFAEAVAPLENEESDLLLNKKQRSDLEAITKVQDKLNGVLREGDKGYKHLSESQYDYVVTIERNIKALKDQESTNKALFQYEMARRAELQKQAIEDLTLHTEIAEKEYQLRQNLFNGTSTTVLGLGGKQVKAGGTDEDQRNALDALNDARKKGTVDDRDFQSIKNKIEIQSERASPARKAFLEETEGLGKFSQGVENVFGPDGSLTTGFSRAIASSIAFHDSFRKSIADLGKAIEAELIQTLVQGMLRMAVLGLAGGASPTSIPGAGAVGLDDIVRGNPYALAPVGTGHASGGYVSGSRTRIMGYNHGGEYVVNAQATQGNMDVLDAINQGKSVRGNGGGMTVTVNNNAAGVEHQVNQIGPNEVEIIARRVVRQDTPKVMAASVRNPNNTFSKSLSNETTARRQR